MRAEWFWDRIEQAVRSLQTELFERPNPVDQASRSLDVSARDHHHCTPGCSCKDRKRKARPLPPPLMALAYGFQKVNSVRSRNKKRKQARLLAPATNTTNVNASPAENVSVDSAEGVLDRTSLDNESIAPLLDPQSLPLAPIPATVDALNPQSLASSNEVSFDFDLPTRIPEEAGAAGAFDLQQEEAVGTSELPSTSLSYQWPSVNESRSTKWTEGFSFDCWRQEVLRKRFQELYRSELSKFSRQALSAATARFESEIEVYKSQIDAVTSLRDKTL